MHVYLYRKTYLCNSLHKWALEDQKSLVTEIQTQSKYWILKTDTYH